MPTEIYISDDGGFQLGGAADVLFYTEISIDFNWFVNTGVTVEQAFYWDIGEPRLKWYRVVSKCEYITEVPVTTEPNEEEIPNPSGRTNKNATAPVKVDEKSCDNKNQKHFYTQIFLGRSPVDVCNQLKNSNFVWKIISMKEYGCPANLSQKLPDENCNELFEVEYCGFPECDEFCVDFFLPVEIGVSVGIEILESGDDIIDFNNYLFNPSPNDEDPGSGHVSFDKLEPQIEDVTNVFISKFDMDLNDQSPWYDTFDEPTSSIKGQITVTDVDGDVFQIFDVVGNVTPNSTGDYYKIPVIHSSGNTVPDPEEEVIVSFTAGYESPPEIVAENDLDAIEPVFRTVRPTCANYTSLSSCFDIPYRLYCYHNLIEHGGTFSNFLKRNGFTLEPAVNMQYSLTQDSWSGSFHFSGAGDGPSTLEERWKFIFQWTCLPINQAVGLLGSSETIIYGDDLNNFPSPTQIGIGENDVGVAVWMFRMAAQRKKINLATKEQINFNSFFYTFFHAGSICQSQPDGLLDFPFKFDYNQNQVLDSAASFCYQSAIIDRIGLFDTVQWTKNPILSFKVSWLDPRLPGDKLDINSLLNL